MRGFWERTFDRGITWKGFLLFIAIAFGTTVIEDLVRFPFTGFVWGLIKGAVMYFGMCALLKEPWTFSMSERQKRKGNER